jgi:hypothetical protein
MEAGVRIDLIVGKGVGALVAAFGAIQAGEKLHGRSGLIQTLTRRKPWRFRTPYLVSLVCLAAAFGVFVSPALVGLLLLIALPLLAVARIVFPGAVDGLYLALQERVASFATDMDPIYLRAMAFPLALLFAFLLVRWVIPGFFRRRDEGRGLGRWLGEGLIEISPLMEAVEKSLWEAVRGASMESKPSQRKDIGIRYRDLLSASLGQHGFCELIFYALDLDVGQEVPFVLLKDRYFSRMSSRGPGRGAVAAEPMDLGNGASPLLFDALMASLSPAPLVPSVPLRLPLQGRYGGEVHRFASSILMGQSAVSDAVSAGAQQIIYVSGAPASGDAQAGTLEKMTEAAVRQMLETDLGWAALASERPAMFVVRPDKPRMGAFEFSGRSLGGGERLELSALVAHGARDMMRMFIQPMVGEGSRAAKEPDKEPPPPGGRPRKDKEAWADGPKEL